MGGLEAEVEGVEGGDGGGQGGGVTSLFLLEEGEEGFGKAGKVPEGGRGLVRKGVAALGVDGAEDGGGVVVLEEGAGAEVDGLAGDGHIVGVHDAVDEAEEHPVGDEVCLAADDGGEEGLGVAGGIELGVVAGDGVGGEAAEGVEIATRGEVLEGADAEVSGGDAGEDGAGLRGLTLDVLAGGDGGEGAGGGDAEGSHGLAEEVLAEDGAEGGTAVATAGEGGGAGALELEVVAEAIVGDDLTEEVGAAVTELGDEVAELVAGVGEGDGFGAGGDVVAGEEGDALRGGECGGVEVEVLGEGDVELDELWGRDGGGVGAGEEVLWQAGVGVVEGEREVWGGGVWERQVGWEGHGDSMRVGWIRSESGVGWRHDDEVSHDDADELDWIAGRGGGAGADGVTAGAVEA